MDYGRILLGIVQPRFIRVVHVVLGLGSWAVCLIQHNYSQDVPAQKPSKDLQLQIRVSPINPKIMHPKC